LLRSGGSLGNIQVSYTINGELTPGARVILVAHPLTGDQFVCKKNVVTGRDGWWREYVGPGKAINTDRFCVICTNILGGCMGTTGPETRKSDDDRPWGAEFPIITIQDMVHVQREFLRYIGVDHLHTVIGGSMGGMQVLEWLRLYPEVSDRYLIIASSYRQPVQNIGFHEVGRRAILLDPKWEHGDYQRKGVFPHKGLAIARMVAHMTYLSPDSLSDKFGRRLQDRNEKAYTIGEEFQIESYLAYQGSSFTERFDANSYLYITKAVDYFDQSEDYGGDLSEAYAHFRGLREKLVDLIAFNSDWLYPANEMKTVYEAVMTNGGKATFTELSAPFGHDSFLMESPELMKLIRELVV
jgi:homoserine O-acetyltransferase